MLMITYNYIGRHDLSSEEKNLSRPQVIISNGDHGGHMVTIVATVNRGDTMPMSKDQFKLAHMHMTSLQKKNICRGLRSSFLMVVMVTMVTMVAMHGGHGYHGGHGHAYGDHVDHGGMVVIISNEVYGDHVGHTYG